MKKRLLLLLCAICAVLLVEAQTSDERHVRDSIFRIYRTMPADTVRTLFLRDAFMRHIDEDWSSELLDSALTCAISMRDAENELSLRYQYFRYYTFRMDSMKMNEMLAVLKEICYRYKKYDYYFLALHYLLQLKGTEGDTEYAIVESRKMRKEAVRLNSDRGIFLSYITEGKSYVFAQNLKKAVELYKKAAKVSGLSAEDELMVHGYLASAYYLLNRYKEVAVELEVRRRIIDDIVKRQPEMLAHYKNTILEIELMYCKIYLADDDADNLKKHLDEIARFYKDDGSLYSSLAISYSFSWAGYYYLKKDWEHCFPQFEHTLSLFKGTQPRYEANIRQIMGDAYMDAGRYKEAAETYKLSVLKRDSVNKATLQMNEETVQANYRIEKALLEKEIAEKRIWQVAVGAGMLFVALLVYGVLRLLRIRRELGQSEKEMRESYALAKAADKMKDVFLHNITNEIRGPLNSVVTLSDVLCQRNDLTVEQQQEYSETIKRNAGKLIDLIFNILDLSRLEAGMMKFNVQEYDAVQLCRDVKLMVEMQNGNAVRLDFRTDLEALPVQVDTGRFMKLLSSVLTPPKGSHEVCKVEYTLQREPDGHLKIIVVNSPLLQVAGSEREREIQHTINRLYLETFKGSYWLCKENGKQSIIILYPIN